MGNGVGHASGGDFLVPALILLVSVIDEQIGRFVTALPQYAASLAQKLEPVLVDLKDNFPGLDPG